MRKNIVIWLILLFTVIALGLFYYIKSGKGQPELVKISDVSISDFDFKEGIRFELTGVFRIKNNLPFKITEVKAECNFKLGDTEMGIIEANAPIALDAFSETSLPVKAIFKLNDIQKSIDLKQILLNTITERNITFYFDGTLHSKTLGLKNENPFLLEYDYSWF